VRLHVVARGGTVTAYGMHFHCQGSCSLSAPLGSPVILEARPKQLFSFRHWAGACHGKGTACVVSLPSAKSARAVFSRNTAEVLVTVGGAGFVRVVNRSKDKCGGSSRGCEFGWPTRTTIRLAAVPAAGGSFGGWGGACAGTSGTVCRVVVRPNGLAVTAAFATTPTGSGGLQPLQLQALDASIQTSLPGFSCRGESKCATPVATGTLVKLHANPIGPPNSPWAGACVGYGYTCVLVVDGPTAVIGPDLHAFGPPSRNALTVNVAGGGVVTDSQRDRCTMGRSPCVTYHRGPVRLTAEPGKGYAFDTWVSFGVCPTKRPICTTLVPTSGTTVTARFKRQP
jgi:Divergent InlB B-repeat domain